MSSKARLFFLLLSSLDFSNMHNQPLILNPPACPAQTAPIKGDFND